MELDKTNIFRYLTCIHEADVQLVPTSICILLEDRWDAISPIFWKETVFNSNQSRQFPGSCLK